MINLILFALWFFLPAGLANAAPVVANKIPYLRDWKTPIDFGKSFRGKRILGDNKSWRGFCFGVLVAFTTFVLQQYLYSHGVFVNQLSAIDYGGLSVWFGALLGVGALGGDAIESFFKRQAGVNSGESWFPFDQIDYILGGILLSSLVINLSPSQNGAILLVWFGMHLLWSYIGFALGLKKKPI